MAIGLIVAQKRRVLSQILLAMPLDQSLDVELYSLPRIVARHVLAPSAEEVVLYLGMVMSR